MASNSAKMARCWTAAAESADVSMVRDSPPSPRDADVTVAAVVGVSVGVLRNGWGDVDVMVAAGGTWPGSGFRG